jgi:hypothetical protein
MTPEMISKARNNAAKSGYQNVEFLLGVVKITENRPFGDHSESATLMIT